MTELTVMLEASDEVASLLLQAAKKGLIETAEDAKDVWKQLVSIAAAEIPSNMRRKHNQYLARLQEQTPNRYDR